MNDLIKAAKALIADWDKRQVVGDADLRAAVERAEKQETAYFDEWMQKNATAELESVNRIDLFGLWYYVKQAERARIKQIISYQFGELVSDLSEVMEMIDDD